MHERGIGGRPPRAVPYAPIDALIARADAVAKRWLIELLDSAPLTAAAEMPVADLAADGPAVCAAAMEALGTERGLQGALRQAHDLARLAGASDASGVVASAEALRRAIWAAVVVAVPRGEDALLAALADRLAHVCAALAQAATALPQSAREATPEGGAADQAAVPADRGADFADEEAEPPLPRAATGEPDFVPLWMAALERQIGAGGRFGLLLVELDGIERLRASETAEALAAALERVGRGVRRSIRREDVLAHETDGRLWIIAPGAGRTGASAVARRIARAVEGAAELRGAPLTASIGAALFPDDAREPEALAGEAEQSVLAARAAGVRFAGDATEPVLGPRLVR
jgi:GGDEF domain-containing protein